MVRPTLKPIAMMRSPRARVRRPVIPVRRTECSRRAAVLPGGILLGSPECQGPAEAAQPVADESADALRECVRWLVAVCRSAPSSISANARKTLRVLSLTPEELEAMAPEESATALNIRQGAIAKMELAKRMRAMGTLGSCGACSSDADGAEVRCQPAEAAAPKPRSPTLSPRTSAKRPICSGTPPVDPRVLMPPPAHYKRKRLA